MPGICLSQNWRCMFVNPFHVWGALANSPLYELIFLFYMPKMKHPRCQPSIWNVLKIFLINLKTCSKKSDFRWKCTFVTPCHVWGVFANSPINKIYFPFFYLQDEASTMPGIYLQCPKNIFDKFKNLFEKVWFSAEIRRSTFVTPAMPGIYLKCPKHIFDKLKTLYDKVQFLSENWLFQFNYFIPWIFSFLDYFYSLIFVFPSYLYSLNTFILVILLFQ